MKVILVVMLLTISNLVLAVGNITAVEIDGVYVREERVDVYLKSPHSNPGNCEVLTQLVLISGEFKNSELMYSAILSAHMAGKKISGYVYGCHDNRAKLHAVYIEP